MKILPTIRMESKILSIFQACNISRVKLLERQRTITYQMSTPYTSPKIDQMNRLPIHLSDDA